MFKSFPEKRLNLEQLYHQYKNLVYNLALHYVQNKEDAEEISQDVFVRIHEKLASFQHNAKISTWIYRITIHKSLDYLKARKRKKRFAQIFSIFFPDSAELKYNPSTADHPGALLEQKEAINRLFSHINELPDAQRTALILTKLEGKTQAETAEIMDTSIKAVESLLQRAKNKLHQKIKDSEGL